MVTAFVIRYKVVFSKKYCIILTNTFNNQRGKDVLKLRVTGLIEEVESFVSDFKKRYQVMQVSKSYPNRDSDYVRVYIEFEKK